MKPTATLEDYQNREKFLIKYIERQIKNLEKLVWMENMDEINDITYLSLLGVVGKSNNKNS